MEDNKKQKKKRFFLSKKLKKNLIIALASLILISLIVVIGLYLGNGSVRLWMDKYILRKDIGEENLPKIEIEEGKNLSIYAYSDYVAIASSEKLTIYNKWAGVVNTIDVVVNTPKFYSNGKYLLLADEGGQNLYLIYNDSLEWHKELEGDISQITVNKNGAVSVVLSGTTHKSVIVTYNINGNEEFKTYLSTTIATDVAISNDNKYLSFVEVKTSGTVVESLVKTISIEKAKSTPAEAIINTYTTNSDTLILKIKYKDDKIIAYCDDGIYVFKSGNEEEILKIENNISFADINLDGNVCIVGESKSSNILNSEYELRIRNVDSKKEHTYIVKSAIKSLYCNNDIIAINLGNEVEFINTSGWLVKKFTSIQNIKEMRLGESVAAIIYKDKIEIIDF